MSINVINNLLILQSSRTAVIMIITTIMITKHIECIEWVSVIKFFRVVSQDSNS